jgi:hypothetical protein
MEAEMGDNETIAVKRPDLHPEPVTHSLDKRTLENLRLLGNSVRANQAQNPPKTGHKNNGRRTHVQTREKKKMEQQTQTTPHGNGNPGTHGARSVPSDMAAGAALEAAVSQNIGNATRFTEALAKRAESGQPLFGIGKLELAKRTGIVVGIGIAGVLLTKAALVGIDYLARPAV